ncbi:uncharacterized protein [Rutidosis leptorrhynchoides]|uniref:uncharacterized protein isoform X2 n=1 Tax=Rutidosis leptorrhynchoides TaxID=125765 RepID=UPI003A9985CE
MEQNGGSTKRKKIRINWKSPKVVKTFLQACIVEVAKNGHMQALSWKRVAAKLKSSHNFIVDRKQMTNHYNYLKSKYKAWSELRNKAEYAYDPVTNTFNLTEEEWELEVKGNKFVESLKSTTLLYPNLCAQLFDGVVVIEDEIGESSSQKSHVEPESPTKKAKTFESAEPLLIKSTEEINGAQEISTSKQNCSSPVEPESTTKKAKTLKNSSAEPILIENTEAVNGNQETSTSKQNWSSHAKPKTTVVSMSTPSPNGKFSSSGMEQNGESTKRKKFRICWTSVKVVKTFLQACIMEVAQNGQMQASSWKKVAEKLKSSHNFIVDQKQMSNHYNYLKSKYKAWSDLRNKAEYDYDPVTNTFNLTEDEWELEIKENKFVESLKSTTLLYPNLCAQLFDGVVVMEDEIGESSSQKSESPRNGAQETSTSNKNSCSRVKPESPTKKPKTSENLIAEPLLIKSTETSTSKQNRSSHLERESPTKKAKTLKDPSAEPVLFKNTEVLNGNQETSTSKQNCSSPIEPKRPAKKAKTLKNPIISVTEDEMSNALKLFVTGNDGPSFKDCRDKLCSLGWGAKNPLHKMALVIFCESATYRDAWMQLEDDEVEDWVRMVGHKLRLAA